MFVCLNFRLINLQSLSRTTSGNKNRSKNKIKAATGDQNKLIENDTGRPVSPADDAHYTELSPSEDEGNYDEDGPRVTNFYLSQI